jgi:hypothetical protein
MYPSDFASNLEGLTLEEIRAAIHHLLDVRDEKVWMLFGTLPFYECSSKQEDGDIIVTDFGDTPPLGNIQTSTLPAAYEKWIDSSIAKELSCHCPAVSCLGPNILVKNSYYQDIDFACMHAKIEKKPEK